MDVTQVNLVNSARVFILENVLEPDVLDYAHQLADTFSITNPLWKCVGSRWNFDITDKSFIPVKEAVDRGAHLEYWQNQLVKDTDRQLYCSNISFFIDLPGSPRLQPHVETLHSWLSQVYITKQTHLYNGTTLYNDSNQVLFQLPYRNNMGWLFDTADRVMHGRAHGVPTGLDRFSIMVWYALLPV
jgi:hypothetical protein